MFGVAHRIAEKITHNPSQQRQVGFHPHQGGDVVQAETANPGHLAVLLSQRIQQRVDGKGRFIGVEHSGVKTGDVHQRSQQPFDIFQRPANMADQCLGRCRKRMGFQGTG